MGFQSPPTFGGLTPPSGALTNGGILWNNAGVLAGGPALTDTSGRILAGDGTIANPGISFGSSPGTGFHFGSGSMYFDAGGTRRWRVGQTFVTYGSTVALNWTSGADADGTVDLSLSRDAANVLAQRTGTAAQAFRIYNTFTDASNYERINLTWTGGLFAIAMDAAGTGSANRTIRLDAANTLFDVTPNGASIARNGTSNPTTFTVGSTGLTSTAILHTRLTPGINQASGSYVVLDINPTETAIGAGPHYLIRGRIGAGADVFTVSNGGAIAGASGSFTGTSRILNAASAPSGGTAGFGYKFGTGNFGIFWGTGAPTLVALKGSLYLRDDGSGTTDRAYIATDSAGTWTALTTVA